MLNKSWRNREKLIEVKCEGSELWLQMNEKHCVTCLLMAFHSFNCRVGTEGAVSVRHRQDQDHSAASVHRRWNLLWIEDMAGNGSRLSRAADSGSHQEPPRRRHSALQCIRRKRDLIISWTTAWYLRRGRLQRNLLAYASWPVANLRWTKLSSTKQPWFQLPLAKQRLSASSWRWRFILFVTTERSFRSIWSAYRWLSISQPSSFVVREADKRRVGFYLRRPRFPLPRSRHRSV